MVLLEMSITPLGKGESVSQYVAECLELVEKGETTRGREVIRVTAEDDDEQDAATQSTASRTQQPQRGGAGGANAAAARAGKNATHRLTVQDYKGRRLHALELRRIDGIGIGKTSIGEKILIKAGTVIARGNILLTPDNCTLLGGKVDAWHKSWVEGRLGRLKEAVGAQ
jgi:RecQ-mediated genome instability protein 1